MTRQQLLIADDIEVNHSDYDLSTIIVDKNALSTHFEYIGSGPLICLAKRLYLPTFLSISFRDQRKDLGCLTFTVGKTTLLQIISLHLKEYSLPFSMLINLIDELGFEVNRSTPAEMLSAQHRKTPLYLTYKGEECWSVADLHAQLVHLSNHSWLKIHYGQKHVSFSPFRTEKDLLNDLVYFNNF